jgi:hypothetical protein
MAIPVAILAALALACATPPASPSSSASTIRLRLLPENSGCPAAAVPSPFTIEIDPTGREFVSALAGDGRAYQMLWERGFVGGPLDDPVVRDPAGAVVARGGEVVVNPLGSGALHGHALCAGDALFVLLQAP